MISDKLVKKNAAGREEYLAELKKCILNDEMSEKLEVLIKQFGFTSDQVALDERAALRANELNRALNNALESLKIAQSECAKVNDEYNKMNEKLKQMQSKFHDKGTELLILKNKCSSLLQKKMELEKEIK